MTAEPLIDNLETQLKVYPNDGSEVTIEFDVTIVGTSLFHNIIYTFEVPDILQPGLTQLEFRADYTNNRVCTLASIGAEVEVIRGNNNCCISAFLIKTGFINCVCLCLQRVWTHSPAQWPTRPSWYNPLQHKIQRTQQQLVNNS